MHMWSNSAGTIRRKNNNVESINSASDDSLERFAEAKRSDKAHDHQTVKRHFQKALSNKFGDCADRWIKTQTIVSACKKTSARAKP